MRNPNIITPTTPDPAFKIDRRCRVCRGPSITDICRECRTWHELLTAVQNFRQMQRWQR